MKARVGTKGVALVAVFAALFTVLTLLPGIPIIGGKGRIELAASLAPLFGIVLGPWLGALAAFLGALLAWALPPGSPDPFTGLLMLAPTISSLTAGLATSRKIGRVEGWVPAALVLGILVLAWYATWVGARAPLYPVLHVAGLVLIVVLGRRLAEYLRSNARSKMALAVVVSSYCGIVADHMVGNLAFIASLGVFIPLEVISAWLKGLGLPDVPSLFMFTLPISAAERLAMTAVAALVGIPLVATLKTAAPHLAERR